MSVQERWTPGEDDMDLPDGSELGQNDLGTGATYIVKAPWPWHASQRPTKLRPKDPCRPTTMISATLFSLFVLSAVESTLSTPALTWQGGTNIYFPITRRSTNGGRKDSRPNGRPFAYEIWL